MASPGAAEEIARLEALCETRTKQLNIARMQLKASASGFDAMTVLVKYLTEEVGLIIINERKVKVKWPPNMNLLFWMTHFPAI